MPASFPIPLEDPALLEGRAYVDGAWREGSGVFEVRDPATGDLVAEAADCDAAMTREAIDAAYAAQADWAARLPADRSALLMKLRDLMMEHQHDLGVILCAEMGKPLAEAKGEIAYGASFLEWFAEEGKRVYGDVIPPHAPGKRLVVIKQPVGVVASITPWNFPNAMIARKIAPAFAAGCTVVAKPAEQTPLSATAMAVLADRAGFPPGVFNVLPSAEGAAVGKEMCANPKVRKMTFTGSTEVGRILMRQCADDIKKLSLELGGNAPFIVFDDADIDAAVDGAMASKFRNAGQTCVSANRLYVQKGVYEAFAEKLSAKVGELKVGNGFAEGVAIGPLIDAQGLEKVESHVADALDKGAETAFGGFKHALGGT
ncbi:MAG: aldehyde dehydrogenase family protein, partial [Pseudomonadota bacterium]